MTACDNEHKFEMNGVVTSACLSGEAGKGGEGSVMSLF